MQLLEACMSCVIQACAILLTLPPVNIHRCTHSGIPFSCGRHCIWQQELHFQRQDALCLHLPGNSFRKHCHCRPQDCPYCTHWQVTGPGEGHELFLVLPHYLRAAPVCRNARLHTLNGYHDLYHLLVNCLFNCPPWFIHHWSWHCILKRLLESVDDVPQLEVVGGKTSNGKKCCKSLTITVFYVSSLLVLHGDPVLFMGSLFTY